MSASTMMNNMIQTQGIEEETMMMMLMQKKQGIVTILGSASACDDDTDSASSNSLRRTLSADMSSKKWPPHQNWSSPMKKIASSEELFNHHYPKTVADSSSSSSEEDYEERKEFEAEAEADAEAERERLEIWSAIQRNKKEEQEKSSGGGVLDTWGSIMSLNGDDNNNKKNRNNLEISKSLPVTPYVHPLVKRTKSSLSEKSLEICTESLGSETGSDGLLFSPYPQSKSGELEQQQQQEAEEEKVKAGDDSSACELAEEEWFNNHVAATTTKKSLPRSFPPPLPSLSSQAKGSSLHMRPRRDNGRLVLEAVSLPSQNNFNAQRQDGRLVLTFANEEEENSDEEEGVEELEEEEFGEEFDQEEEDKYDDESKEEVEDVESVIEEAPLMSSEITTTTATNVHRLTLMMNKNNKPIGLVNRNPNWSQKFDKGVNFDDVNVVEMESGAAATAMAQTLPPRPRVARLIPSPAAQAVASAASGSFNLNAYECYWRAKPTPKAASASQVPNQNNNSPNNDKVIVSGGINQTPGGQQQLLVLRGKNGDYLVHNLKSCKDSRRSLLFWEPYCIATS